MSYQITRSQIEHLGVVLDADADGFVEEAEFDENVEQACQSVFTTDPVSAERLREVCTFENYASWAWFFGEHAGMSDVTLDDDGNVTREQEWTAQKAPRNDVEIAAGSGAGLSQAEFDRLFPADEDLAQANVGDCYLIAFFDSFRNSPHFEEVVRSGMRVVPAGDGTVYYEVRMPLTDPDGVWIKVTGEDMAPHANAAKGTAVGKEQVCSSSAVGYDTREELGFVWGPPGFIVLEAAFAKSVNRRNDVIDGIAVGDLGADGLAGGDYAATDGMRYQETLRETGINRLEIEGGYSLYAAEAFLGPAVSYQFVGYQRSDPAQLDLAKQWLDWLDLGGDMVCAYSHTTNEGSDTETYVVGGQVFYANHEYAVRSIDRDADTVTLVNPWDTSMEITLTYDEFLRAFNGFDVMTWK